MTRFSATESARTSKQIAEETERPNIGRVGRVHEHVIPEDDPENLDEEFRANFEVDVDLLDSPGKTLRGVEFQFPQADEIKVPKVGDIVLVEYRGKSNKKPSARASIPTNNTRPPRGRAGMWRKRVPSGASPAGSGDLYIESYTGYDQDPSEPGFDDGSQSETLSFIRLSKKARDNDNPVDGDTLPMMVELFDSPENDESYIKMEGNVIDGDDTKSMSVDLDLKDGIIKVTGDNSTEFGLELDVTSGTFKLLDDGGYGIESDGSGDFKWHYRNIDYKEDSTTSF